MGLKPKNKGHANFYECCDLTEKVYLLFIHTWIVDRPVIYTPLKICSIYAGVIGAVATAAALIDRNRNGGIGRDVHASRLAGMYLNITGN